MNNYERIKNMSIDEMAETLRKICHNWNGSKDFFKQWLESEEE